MRRDRRSSSPEGVSLPATTGGATMINGAHAIVYSTNPEADRAFLRDVLKLPSVDVGEGWLIFGLPPAEVAVHPSNNNDVHELYLMVDDIEAVVAEMNAHHIACSAVQNQGWGLLTRATLPGGGTIGIYQPRHARPKATSAGNTTKKRARRASKRTSRAHQSKSARAKARRR